jgi:bacterioferritin-associated ferredoxin
LKTDPDPRLLNNLPTTLKQDLDKNLCTCMDVPKREVIDAIVKGAMTLEEVKKETYAATGAGCCVQQVERLIECLSAPPPGKRRTAKNKVSEDKPVS